MTLTTSYRCLVCEEEGVAEVPLDACGHCHGPACERHDLCNGCGELICRVCDTEPTERFLFVGDEYFHPHNEAEAVDTPLTPSATLGPTQRRPRQGTLISRRSRGWRMRFSQAIDEWVKDLTRARKSPNTIRAYQDDLRHLAGQAGRDSILEFTVATVKRAFDTWSESGQKPSSLHRRQTAVRMFGRWGKRRRYWLENPMDEIDPIAKPDCLPRPFTNDERDRLLALDLPPQEDLARELLIGTGLRVTPVCSLRVGSISWDPPQLRVIVKGGRTQVIPIYEKLRDKLYTHLESRGTGLRVGEPILAYRNGSPIHRSTLERWAKAWGKEAGVANCTPHRFRHLFASTLLETGADLRTVQETLGHRSIQSTTIYTRVTSDRQREAIARLPWAKGPAAAPKSDNQTAAHISLATAPEDEGDGWSV